MADRKKRIYPETEATKRMRALWLKAAKETVVIECATAAEAQLIRFQMYNAVKRVREEPASNPELHEAIGTVQIALRGEGKNILRIGRSEAMEKLDETFAKLGIIDGVKVKDDIELDADESAQRMLERIQRGDFNAT